MDKPPVEEELGGARATLTLDALARRIRAARAVLITSHVNPDGDAIGSELGLAQALRKLGKKVWVVNDHPSPDKYAFLDPQGTIEVLVGEPGPEAYAGADLGILLDTSEPSRTGRLEKRFFSRDLERICLDHHPGPENPLFLHHWVAEKAAATGSLVLRLMDRLEVEPDLTAATALFVAIATDTGWFRFQNTRPSTLNDAARLVSSGVKPEEIYRRIYEESSPPRLVLLGQLFAGLKVEMGGRLVWSLLDRAALERSGVPYQELDGFAEELKSVRGAEVVATIMEIAPRAFKVSLRSRGETPVNAIAAAFGGGGHAKAAGFRTTADFGEVLAGLRREVERALGRPASSR